MTVYRTETGKWRYDFEAKGRRWTGSGFAAKRDALAAQEQRRKELWSNLSAGILSFRELVDAFLSMSARTKSADWTYQLTVKLNKACAHLGPMLLSELRPEHFETVLTTLHRSGKNRARSLNEYRKIMHAVMEFGVKLEALHRNPVKKLERQPENTVPVVPVDTAVLNQLILAADPVLSALLTFQSQTGARYIECERLTWPAVQLSPPPAFAKLRTKKNRRREDSDRTQPLNRIAIGALERMRGLHRDVVFPAADGGPLAYRTILKRLHELCDRLKLERVSFHQVRHWTGLQVVSRGRSKKAVAIYLGHGDTSATEKYLHVLDEQMLAIARELEDAGVDPAPGSCGSRVGNGSATSGGEAE